MDDISEDQAEMLIETRKAPDFAVAEKSPNALIELMRRKMPKQSS